MSRAGPPYYNLEQYKAGPADLSGLASYEAFLYKYTRIIANAVGLLRPKAFACAFKSGGHRGAAYQRLVTGGAAPSHPEPARTRRSRFCTSLILNGRLSPSSWSVMCGTVPPTPSTPCTTVGLEIL